MPYLEQNFRDEIEKVIGLDKISEYANSLEPYHFSGFLNYLITFLVKRYLNRYGISYFTLAHIVGTIHCAVYELYHVVVAPYEDQKRIQNGDVK